MSAPFSSQTTPAPTTALARLHAGHWRDKRRLTCQLLAIWLLSTFSVIYFARDLDHIVLFGWPLSYYMAAQGLALVYLALVVTYNRRIQRMERALAKALLPATATAPISAPAVTAATNPKGRSNAG
jgi:putative solute:sodium symporter small subunit